MRVKIKHDLHPNDNAMVQALYSRSPAPVETHLEKVNKADSGKFYEKYVVKYGHESIADCAVTTIFIEDVSMIAAKEIQNHSLYNGQESSTRFIDYNQQGVALNVEDDENARNGGLDCSDAITLHQYATRWMELYKKYLPYVKEGVSKKTGLALNSNGANAKAFDIMRGFLPCAAKTNLSWTTTLRNARSHLLYMLGSESDEVRGVAKRVYKELAEEYPSSFDVEELNGFFRNLYGMSVSDFESSAGYQYIYDDLSIDLSTFNTRDFKDFIWLGTRECGDPLPRETDLFGTIRWNCALDFGSYRDIQRHRNGYCSLPQFSGIMQVHNWYTDQFNDLVEDESVCIDFQTEVSGLLNDINDTYKERLSIPDNIMLYALPMGIVVDFVLSYSIRQCVYVSELRSSPAVHPTLRTMAMNMGRFLNDNLSAGIHIDDSDIDYERRGKQTITEK